LPAAEVSMQQRSLNENNDVVVPTTKVTANSRIFITIQDPLTGTPGVVFVVSRIPGFFFTIRSSLLDVSRVALVIVEPN